MREYLTGGVFLCLSAYAHASMVILNRLIPSKHTRRFTAIFSDVLKTLAFSIINPIFSHIFTLGRSLAFLSYPILQFGNDRRSPLESTVHLVGDTWTSIHICETQKETSRESSNIFDEILLTF